MRRNVCCTRPYRNDTSTTLPTSTYEPEEIVAPSTTALILEHLIEVAEEVVHVGTGVALREAVVLETFLTILVVDLALLLVRENLVGWQKASYLY